MTSKILSSLILISSFFLASCQKEYTLSQIGEKNILPIVVSKWNNTLLGTVFKVENIYVTAYHTVRDDSAKIHIKNQKNCRVYDRDKKKDIVWISCGENSENPHKKIYPHLTKIWKYILIPVYRKNKIQYMTGKIIENSAIINSIDSYGNQYTLSGIVLTDVSLKAGDSGAPIFEKDSGRWVGVIHTQ